MNDLAGGAGGVLVPVAPFARAELPGAQSDPARFPDSVDVQILHRPTVAVRGLESSQWSARWLRPGPICMPPCWVNPLSLRGGQSPITPLTPTVSTATANMKHIPRFFD